MAVETERNRCVKEPSYRERKEQESMQPKPLAPMWDPDDQSCLQRKVAKDLERPWGFEPWLIQWRKLILRVKTLGQCDKK